jgi:hypothetical protein
VKVLDARYQNESNHHRSMMKCFTIISAGLALLAGTACTAAKPVTRQLWFSPPGKPDGRCLRELFEPPDQWAETRSLVQALGYADHALHR